MANAVFFDIFVIVGDEDLSRLGNGERNLFRVAERRLQGRASGASESNESLIREYCRQPLCNGRQGQAKAGKGNAYRRGVVEQPVGKYRQL